MVECSASSNNDDADLLKSSQSQQQPNNNEQDQQQAQPQEQQLQNQENNQQQESSDASTNNNNNSNSTKLPLTQKQQQANNLTEELFSAKGWGDTPIRQDTPWDLPPSPSTTNDSATNASGLSAQGLGSGNNTSTLLAPNNGPAAGNHNQISSLNHSQPTSSLATNAVVPPGHQLQHHASTSSAAVASSLANSHSTSAQVGNSSGAGGLVGGNNAHSTLPPGISQSSDNNFRTGNDFNSQSMINNFNVDNMNAIGLANSLGHMNLGGASSGVMHQTASSRYEQQQQSWRAAPNMVKQPSTVSASPFAHPNLMNQAQSSIPKSMLNSGQSGGSSNATQSSSFAIGRQPGGVADFTRAPGPTASSMIDNNKNKPFGVPIRSSTWSAFGTSAYADSESESEWAKSSGISGGGPTGQAPTPFDLTADFGETAKAWQSSMLIKGLDEDTGLNSNSAAAIGAFPNSYAASSKSPTDVQNDSSGIGTWSPVVKTGRPGSKWDGDGSDNGQGDSSRFDDGTSIWGRPFPTKVTGTEWGDKSSDTNANDEKSRNIAGNNQAYRSSQSSSSAGMIMSSNFSPPTQQNRNPQTMKQPSLSQNFEQSNALSSQPNQPNRGLGLSSINVPSTQQLKHMVQQIQLAVQAGHLNPQILNQPLAPVTLQLLCQLLQQIKVLHQFQMQATKQQFGKPINHPAAVNVQITKTKQNIINLQNQIAAQQANFLKTQAHNISSRQTAMPALATGPVGGITPGLPPGISQSGDNNFRTGNDFHSQSMINNYNVDNMGPNGLTNSLGHMNLSGGATGVLHQQTSRFDQSWRAPMAKQHQPSMASTSPFANPNLMNHSPSSMPKSMLNCGPGGGLGNGGGLQSSYGVGGMQNCATAGDFTRAPGPTSSIMDNKNKSFGVANRSSTWSAFSTQGPSDSDSEWPKSSGISAGSSGQHNAVDMVPEFEPGKPWRGSMLMKSVEDDPTMTPASLARSLAPQRKTIWSDEIL